VQVLQSEQPSGLKPLGAGLMDQHLCTVLLGVPNCPLMVVSLFV
jgi:hypothetical protein